MSTVADYRASALALMAPVIERLESELARSPAALWSAPQTAPPTTTTATAARSSQSVGPPWPAGSRGTR